MAAIKIEEKGNKKANLEKRKGQIWISQVIWLYFYLYYLKEFFKIKAKAMVNEQDKAFKAHNTYK